MKAVIRLRCEVGHEQEIRWEGSMIEEARAFAQVLDGSHPMFVVPPIPGGLTGWCGVCREGGKNVDTRFTATVVEERESL